MRGRMGRMSDDYYTKNAEQAMAGCESCGGSGVLRGSATVPCAACNGTGRIMGQHCPECRGLEFQVVEIDAPCNQCGGSGFVPLNKRDVEAKSSGV
jgi:DnaJ-class molecular chaperone